MMLMTGTHICRWEPDQEGCTKADPGFVEVYDACEIGEERCLSSCSGQGSRASS